MKTTPAIAHILIIFLSLNAAVKEVTQLLDCVYRQNARFFTLNDILLFPSVLLYFFLREFFVFFFLLRCLFGFMCLHFFESSRDSSAGGWEGWLHAFILQKLKWIAGILFSNEKMSELCTHSSQRALPVTAQLIFRFFSFLRLLLLCCCVCLRYLYQAFVLHCIVKSTDWSWKTFICIQHCENRKGTKTLRDLIKRSRVNVLSSLTFTPRFCLFLWFKRSEIGENSIQIA